MAESVLNMLVVGVGSGLGGMLRFFISLHSGASSSSGIPWGTLAVNLAGCLFIGLIYGIIDRGIDVGTNLKLFLTVGFCGGFTTYSTFVNENMMLIERGDFVSFIAYSGMTILFGLALVFVGYHVVKTI